MLTELELDPVRLGVSRGRLNKSTEEGARHSGGKSLTDGAGEMDEDELWSTSNEPVLDTE